MKAQLPTADATRNTEQEALRPQSPEAAPIALGPRQCYKREPHQFVPSSVDLTILKDIPDAMAWRYEEVDATGKSSTISWSGPLDGSMQDMKAPDGQGIGKQSMKRDGDVMLRHVEVPNVGTFDSRVTTSADGNTFTDVVTMKSQEGKTATDTVVFHRVAGGKPSSK